MHRAAALLGVGADRYVLSSVRLAQPFAALPPQSASPSLPVSATFRFQVADGPPAR
ncbi:MAG TPA: hypothetical protein VKA83_27080 [Methylomirabilota bacterium]|nr:hypothetical protein [Methylomirabilota bacterium]